MSVIAIMSLGAAAGLFITSCSSEPMTRTKCCVNVSLLVRAPPRNFSLKEASCDSENFSPVSMTCSILMCLPESLFTVCFLLR